MGHTRSVHPQWNVHSAAYFPHNLTRMGMLLIAWLTLYSAQVSALAVVSGPTPHDRINSAYSSISGNDPFALAWSEILGRGDVNYEGGTAMQRAEVRKAFAKSVTASDFHAMLPHQQEAVRGKLLAISQQGCPFTPRLLAMCRRDSDNAKAKLESLGLSGEGVSDPMHLGGFGVVHGGDKRETLR